MKIRTEIEKILREKGDDGDYYVRKDHTDSLLSLFEKTIKGVVPREWGVALSKLEGDEKVYWAGYMKGFNTCRKGILQSLEEKIK